MPKPNDFHIGVIEFFSILLPGALLTAALVGRFHPELAEPLRSLLAPAGADWVAFALASYAAGHFVFLVAAMLDGLVYDRLELWKRFRGGADHCYLRATEARQAFFGTLERDVPMNSFAWAKSVLRLRAPAALADVERYEADSKFFRSLVVVIPVTAVLLAASPLLAALAAALTLASFFRYAERRYKSTEWAYRYLLVLIETPSPDPRR
ncbi:hypothetical protein E5A73_12205 [Sphingomonas gei]|uniref:Uncharacterized protein n=1 Tax=Sphingomonas gei TaxID=1395960 RepID=A0A4S1XD30_9SPHN|nr:hypothetical protein [Sphingomonas gei]TGX53583.1 hypothetical protein E5A73_12205 [Sphingomonas gei]